MVLIGQYLDALPERLVYASFDWSFETAPRINKILFVQGVLCANGMKESAHESCRDLVSFASEVCKFDAVFEWQLVQGHVVGHGQTGANLRHCSLSRVLFDGGCLVERPKGLCSVNRFDAIGFSMSRTSRKTEDYVYRKLRQDTMAW